MKGVLQGNRRSFYDDSKLQEDANYKTVCATGFEMVQFNRQTFH